jgi:hypothetical protein
MILAKRPHAAVGIAADEVVGVEFDDRRCDHIKKFLYAHVLLRPDSRSFVDFGHYIISCPRKVDKKACLNF